MDFLKTLWSIDFIRYGVSIFIGFIVALYIIGIVGHVVGKIFYIVGNRIIRLIVCILIEVLILYNIFDIGVIREITLIYTLLYMVLLIIKENKEDSLIKSGKFKRMEQYSSNSCTMWGWSFVNCLLLPILVTLPSIICNAYGVPVQNFISFYWDFEYGIFAYIIIRFILLAIIIEAPLGMLSVFARNDNIVSTESIEFEAAEEEKENQEKILRINPDAFEKEKQKIKQEETINNEIDKKDNIIEDDVLAFINNVLEENKDDLH